MVRFFVVLGLLAAVRGRRRAPRHVRGQPRFQGRSPRSGGPPSGRGGPGRRSDDPLAVVRGHVRPPGATRSGRSAGVRVGAGAPGAACGVVVSFDGPVVLSGAGLEREASFHAVLEPANVVTLWAAQAFTVDEDAFVLELGSPGWLADEGVALEAGEHAIGPESELGQWLALQLTARTSLFADPNGSRSVEGRERERVLRPRPGSGLHRSWRSPKTCPSALVWSAASAPPWALTRPGGLPLALVVSRRAAPATMSGGARERSRHSVAPDRSSLSRTPPPGRITGSSAAVAAGGTRLVLGPEPHTRGYPWGDPIRIGQEHPEVEPQLTHLRQAPLRTMVNAPHSSQASPSYPWARAFSTAWIRTSRPLATGCGALGSDGW